MSLVAGSARKPGNPEESCQESPGILQKILEESRRVSKNGKKNPSASRINQKDFFKLLWFHENSNNPRESRRTPKYPQSSQINPKILL